MSQTTKLITTTGLHKDIVILGYDTTEAFDADAGKAGAALEEANYNVIYRDTLPTIQDAVIPKIEALTGIKLGINEKLTAKAQEAENAAAAKAGREPKKKVVNETFKDYDARVKATVDDEMWQRVDALVREVALATPVDSKPTVRSGGLSKANLDKADDVLGRSVDNIELAVAKLIAVVREFDLARSEEGKPVRNSLARLIGEFVANPGPALTSCIPWRAGAG